MPDGSIPDAVTTGRLTDVPGIAVGHWSDTEARTGCTVVLLPEGTVASGEIRGGGPATREFGLLDPLRHVNAIDAVVLSGGSAFGLATADGVMGFLADAGRGYVTTAARIPLVPTLCVYDLMVGDSSVRPGAAEGRLAAEAASDDGHDVGLVGAGTGCTTGKWAGPDHIVPGGLVAASARLGSTVVACLVAVNAVGSVGADATLPDVTVEHPILSRRRAGENTTIGVVATTAPLDKVECHLLAQSAHHGLARAVFPSHTRFDGDAFVACATGFDPADSTGKVGIDVLRVAVGALVERAVLSLAAPHPM